MRNAINASILTLGMLPTALAAQVTFTGLGKLPEALNCYAQSLSADGLTASGYCATTEVIKAFRWHAGVLHDMGFPAASGYSNGGPLNPNGTIMVGTIGPAQRPARWTLASGEFQDLGFPANTNHVPFSISPDGSTVWGFGGNSPFTPRVFRWTAATSVQYLALPPGYSASSGGRASADGSIVVGAVLSGDTHNPVRWVNGVPALLTLPIGYTKGNAAAVSADGQVIAGTINTEFTYYMFRWTQGAGFQIVAGVNSGGQAINADGSVIVGRAWPGTAPYALLWSAQTGPVDLNIHLASLGADLTDWTLDEAFAVSADGRTILGQGTHNGVQEGWIATLPGACYANCDSSTGSPRLNANDFLCFMNAYAASQSYANCDGSTGDPALTANDFQCFFNQFASGCP